MKLSEAIEQLQELQASLNLACEYGEADGIERALQMLERVTDWEN